MTIVEKLLSDAARPADPDEIREDFFRTGEAGGVLEARTARVDAIVARAFEEWLAPASPAGLALLAVGGYGRRELFPHSDVDLLILLAGDANRAVREALSGFLQSLWDARLRLSQSVHTLSECCEVHEHNIELNISLLDQRCLAGDPALYDRLNQRLPRFLHGQRHPLMRHVCRLTRQRHARHQETIYHLEPNIKECPGGLRDLHAIAWLTQLAPEPGAGELAEPEELSAARAFLFAVRCFLHYSSGRDNNLLNFEAQEELAELPFQGSRDPAEWMRNYFRHARTIHLAGLRILDRYEGQSSSLLAGFRDWRARLATAEFSVSKDRVFFKAPHQMAQDPEVALRFYQFVGRHRMRPHAEAERRVQEHLPELRAYFGQARALWPQVWETLTLPHVSLALRAMHEAGFLTAVFPEWKHIESFVVRDFHHRYTVDEHTLLALEQLEALERTADPARQRFAFLLSEIGDPAVLRMALLFHDTGKGLKGEGHLEESAALADQAATRIQMPAGERQMLRFLIERHLDLSATMLGRDLKDPATVRELAGRVETLENLKNLALLTYADISAVNPSAMSPWRLEQLWRVYVATYNELTRELATERIETAGTAPPEREAFLKGLPTRYLRVHSEAEIAHHFQLEDRRRQAGVAVEVERQGAVYQATLLAKDRLYLFASIAGALASFGLNILKAEAFSNQQGTVLDTFVFEDPQRTLELNPPEVDRLRQTLERVLLGRVQVKDLLKHRSRPASPGKRAVIEGRVAFNNDASESATLVEIMAHDRPGLLYDLASAFSQAGCNIEVVLVDTEAHKAIDVFYVTAGGGKLSPTLQRRLGEDLMQACRG